MDFEAIKLSNCTIIGKFANLKFKKIFPFLNDPHSCQEHGILVYWINCKIQKISTGRFVIWIFRHGKGQIDLYPNKIRLATYFVLKDSANQFTFQFNLKISILQSHNLMFTKFILKFSIIREVKLLPAINSLNV